MNVVTNRVQRERDLAVAPERRSWDSAVKARKKRANVGLTENVAGAQEKVVRGNVAARSWK